MDCPSIHLSPPGGKNASQCELFKGRHEDKGFLDNFCLDSSLRFESIAASTGLPKWTSDYFFFSILSMPSLCLRICSPSLSSSSSFSSPCSSNGLTHCEFPESANLRNTALLSRVREHNSKFLAPPGTVFVQEILAMLIPSPGNVTWQFTVHDVSCA